MNDETKQVIQKDERANQPKLLSRASRKKKYTKPGVVYQSPLEAMAGTCTLGKLDVGACGGTLFS